MMFVLLVMVYMGNGNIDTADMAYFNDEAVCDRAAPVIAEMASEAVGGSSVWYDCVFVETGEAA